jgi:hypothetical protein
MPAATTIETGESRGKEIAMSDFSTVQAGLLPAGTVTEFGVIVRSSYTAYEVEGGEWIAFHRVHGHPAPVMPLVVLA